MCSLNHPHAASCKFTPRTCPLPPSVTLAHRPERTHSNTRDGKVTSALDGFVNHEPVAWGDQFTLDYNLEATFWGAGYGNFDIIFRPFLARFSAPRRPTRAV